MKVAAFVPAKGSSTRIPNKNLMRLDGEPLFLATLRKLAQSRVIDETVLDTDSAEIAGLARDVRCRTVQRPPALASNATDGNALFHYEVQQTDADICAQVLCTSPFLSLATIERAVRVLKEDPSFDSVVAIRREKQYRWCAGAPEYDIAHIPNSVDLPETVVEAMCLYVMRREAVLALKRRIGVRPYLLELDPIEAVDVNWPKDLELARTIAVGLREQERQRLRTLATVLTSAIISDVLDDMGVHSVLSPQFAANLRGARVLGRARTVQIDPCTDTDDYRRIYDTLSIYDELSAQNIIVVANRVPESAFFGELNARLAIRAGAAAAIVDGVTRDSEETARLGFPVFSKGTYCRDTRRRGVMASKGRTVLIDGVNVHRDDLILADRDGIVVLPRHLEAEALERAIKVVQRERDVVADIASDVSTEALVQRHGQF